MLAAFLAKDTMFDSTISLGNLLTIVSFVAFAVVYVVGTKSAAKVLGKELELRFTMVDASIEDFKEDIKTLNKLIIDQTKSDMKLSNLAETVLAQGLRQDEFTKRFNTYLDILLEPRIREDSRGRETKR